MAGRYSYNVEGDLYFQARDLFERVMSETDREHLISNIVGNLKGAVPQVISSSFLAHYNLFK